MSEYGESAEGSTNNLAEGERERNRRHIVLKMQHGAVSLVGNIAPTERRLGENSPDRSWGAAGGSAAAAAAAAAGSCLVCRSR